MNKDNKRCKCGYESTHAWVNEAAEYNLWGWLIIGIGVSSLPKAIVLKCHQCGFVFERSYDLEKRQKRRFS